MIEVKIKRLSKDAILPKKSNEWDAGFDLFSTEDGYIEPGERILIHTGIALELPDNTEAQIRPRSGLALKDGITVLNTPGTIDSPYRGEIGVILINLGKRRFKIEKGDRIAQMVIKYIEQVNFIECDTLSQTLRNKNGFGSTGL